MNRFTSFESILNDNSSNGYNQTWIPKYTTNYGLCYSYHVPDYLKVAEIKEMSFYDKNNLDVYFHHPGQYLSWQAYAFPMRSTQEVYVDVEYEVNMYK